MARIQNKEYNVAQVQNVEKLSGDYFLKTIQADKEGNFISPFVPAEYDEILVTYVEEGYGIGEIDTVIYKLNGVTLTTLGLSYNTDNKLSGVLKY